MKTNTTFLAVIFIIILGFTAYANSLKGEFIRDDESLVRDNIYIKNWSKAANCFTTDIAAGGRQKWNSYRPLQMLTYMADYSLWKLNVSGYHLTNITLHILAALAVYWLLNIIYGDSLLSLFTSALFVVNPLHVEAVSYISGRADSLSAVFLLLSFIFYIKLIGRKNILFFILMILGYLLALLSRENSLVLCVLLLFYHYVFKKKFSFYNYFPILGITAAYIVIRLLVLKPFLSNIVYTTTLFERMPGFFAALVSYLRLLVLPFNLHTEYGLKLFTFKDPQVILGALVFAVLLIYAFRKRNTDKVLFFSTGWFFITLLPHANLYPINAYMREHWLYLPSIGFFIILANVFKNAYRNKKIRIFAMGVLIFILALHTYLTLAQNNYWKESINFYQQTLKYSPDDYKEYINMGNAYRHKGNYEGAIQAYKKAIELYPEAKEAYNNLGVTYKETGDDQNAVIYFEKAVEIDPNYANAFNSLAVLHYEKGRIADAVAACKKAIELDPSDASPWYNLGNAYKVMGKAQEAIDAYNKAIAINPNYSEAMNNLASVYTSLNDAKSAIKLYQKLLKVNPGFFMAYNNLAVAYYYDQQYGLAVKYCDKAITLGCKVNPEFLKLLKPYR